MYTRNIKAQDKLVSAYYATSTEINDIWKVETGTFVRFQVVVIYHTPEYQLLDYISPDITLYNFDTDLKETANLHWSLSVNLSYL